MVTYASKYNELSRKHSDLWLARHAEHGWVILDRSLPINKNTDQPEEMRFIRCSDGEEYIQGDAPWAYRAAHRFMEDLTMGEALKAEQELVAILEDFLN